MARIAIAKSVRRGPDRPKPKWGEAALTTEEQHQLRRDALFLTAARAFNEAGFYNTTLDDIAARLNVSKPTLYYYVKSKDDILLECNRLAFAHMKDAFREVQRSTQPGIVKVTEFLKTYIELVANPFGRCLIRTGLQPLTPESQEKLRPVARQINRTLQDILQQGIRDGSIRQCDAKLVANAIFGSFNSVALWQQESGPLTPAEIAAHYIQLFINGLRP